MQIPGYSLADNDDRFLWYVNHSQIAFFDVQRSPDGNTPDLLRSEPPTTGTDQTVSVSFSGLGWSWKTLDTTITRWLYVEGNPAGVEWVKNYDSWSVRAKTGHEMDPGAHYGLSRGQRLRVNFKFSAAWGTQVELWYMDWQRTVGYVLWPAD